MTRTDKAYIAEEEAKKYFIKLQNRALKKRDKQA